MDNPAPLQCPKDAPLPWSADPYNDYCILDANGTEVLATEYDDPPLRAFLIAAANATMGIDADLCSHCSRPVENRFERLNGFNYHPGCAAELKRLHAELKSKGEPQ